VLKALLAVTGHGKEEVKEWGDVLARVNIHMFKDMCAAHIVGKGVDHVNWERANKFLGKIDLQRAFDRGAHPIKISIRWLLACRMLQEIEHPDGAPASAPAAS
jgi:hypothetical protein